MGPKSLIRLLLVAMVGFLLIPIGSVAADQVILDDLIVDGSECVGFDCVNGESFGFDTERLKENNLRIHFNDTSTSASFPDNDWRIVINDTTNGGAEYFAVEDSSAGRQPFRLVAGAPANSLYVDAQGDLGLGTNSPVVELHIKDGDTPTARLEQDGSSGFTPQTWDLAGNETNFFIRDVTNGSKLPFRVRPDAPTSSIDIENTGDVGFGTTSPDSSIHIRRTNATASLKVEEASGTTAFRVMGRFVNNGAPQLNFEDTSSTDDWTFGMNAVGKWTFQYETGSQELVLSKTGDLTITGQLTTATTTYPDYVFADDYDLWPLEKVAAFIGAEGHLPGIATAEDVAAAGGVNMSELQVQLLEKIEELTLYTIEQQAQIDDLEARLAALEAAIGGS